MSDAAAPFRAPPARRPRWFAVPRMLRINLEDVSAAWTRREHPLNPDSPYVLVVFFRNGHERTFALDQTTRSAFFDALDQLEGP